MFILRFLCKPLTWLVLATTVFLAPATYASPETALDDYVNTPDPSYFYLPYGVPISGEGYTVYIIYMASQQWRSFSEVDRIQWTHWMAIIVPDQVFTSTGMLIIAGGSNTGYPDIDEADIALGAQVAINSGSVVSVLGQIPNQPLYFSDEPFAHSEDELVAYSFDKAMDTGDWNWPAYLPMTKAAVQAMTTVQAVTATPGVADISVSHFVVTGFSKRGAATWLTAAVDPRVVAIAPGVFDILNMDEQVEHHFSAYGFYSSALDDFVHYNVLRRVRTPEGQDLMKVVDPFEYKDRLTMPKFILNSSGDEFFTSDSVRFYFDALGGEKLIRYVANTGHGLETAEGNVDDAVSSLVSWYFNFISGQQHPTITWQHVNGQLLVQTNQPAFARLWQAHNPVARDFRLDTIGRSWVAQPLSLTPQLTFSVPVPNPTEGWTAYFVDLIYPAAGGGLPQTYSTTIFISPDTLPFEVTDPLLDPRGVGFWARQTVVAQSGEGSAQIPADTLAGYLPIPLFDQYVRSIEQANTIFAASSSDVQSRAQKQCLALRLNVRDGQLGWYTSVPGDGGETIKLWQRYDQAHQAYLDGNPQQAQAICAAINAL
jgi:PhoPQ-activated pathogenicity-related protein